MTDEEDVRGKGRLKHDGHVGGVEEAHRERSAHTTLAVGLDGNLHAESLEVDDGSENNDSGQEVHNVRQALTVERLAKGKLLVRPGDQKVEEGDDGALELGTAASVDGGGRKGLPHDRLANVSRDEQGDTGAETIALLEELIEEYDH